MIKIEPGDVVRARASIDHGIERTAEQRLDDRHVQCVRIAEDGLPESLSLDVATLDLVWRNDRRGKIDAFRPGDTVQLASGGEILTVDQADERQVHCTWFWTNGLVTRWFPTAAVWLTRATDDVSGRVDAGDVVRLRGGGPRLTVAGGGTSNVPCLNEAGEPFWLDPRTLILQEMTSGPSDAEQLIAIGRRRDIDLGAVSRDGVFHRLDRYIYLSRKTRDGVIYYSMQGAIARVPDAFRHVDVAFRGMWGEGGFFDSLDQALAFVAAWILERREVDDLPDRTCQRLGF